MSTLLYIVTLVRVWPGAAVGLARTFIYREFLGSHGNVIYVCRFETNSVTEGVSLFLTKTFRTVSLETVSDFL